VPVPVAEQQARQFFTRGKIFVWPSSNMAGRI